MFNNKITLMHKMVTAHHRSSSKIFLLTFMALGVVYGDIGTSPLYALSGIFFGHHYPMQDELSIIGSISLVIWAITCTVSLKYLLLVLKADNDGEGGIFALYSNLHHFKNKYIHYLKILLMLAAGLLIGESMITPAISVLSAVEGLAVYNAQFLNYVIPITVTLLSGLFFVQSFGTHRLGKFFGTVAILWFFSIGFFGFISVLKTPQIIKAMNPVWAFRFLLVMNFKQSMIVLGSVLLSITGGEAIFADMGHFGIRPIRLGWYFFVYPALLLNYMGQGAYLLSGHPVFHENIFFSMIPKMALLPMIVLATMATIIASQALISGSFSLASQAVALGLFPRLRILHTHAEHEGQIYVGAMNWFLFLGAVTLVFTFKDSTSLSHAYGLSLTGVMLVTSIAMMCTARLVWLWNWRKILIIFVPFMCLEFIFLGAKSIKFLKGGIIPLGIGLALFIIMRIWRWGRKATYKAYLESESLTIAEMIKLKNDQKYCIDKNVVLLVPRPLRSLEDKAPALVQFFYNRYGLFPRNLFLVEVVHRKIPFVHGLRHESFVFYKDEAKGTVASTAIHFGFMEEVNLELVLEDLAKMHQIALPEDPHKWLVHSAFEKFIPPKKMSLWELVRFRVFLFFRRISEPAHFFYGLGKEVNLSIDIMPIKLK